MMPRTNFLNSDESALFLCNRIEKNGEYDGQCFIVNGPCKTFMDALNAAFTGYDYDTCHAVKRLDNETNTFDDITADCSALVDEDTFNDWVDASLKNVSFGPAFMDREITQASMSRAA